MSTLQDPTRDESQTAAGTGDGTVPRPRTAPERTSGRGRVVRWAGYAVAGVLVAGVGVAGMTRLGGQEQADDAPPAAAVDSNLALKDAPITLPATAGGMSPVGATDVTRRAEWTQQAKQAAGGAVFAARTYGHAGTNHIVRVVAARTDLTGALELAWAADAGTKVGPVSCTNKTRLTPDQPPKVRPTIMLCWRTSGSLSVYALVIDPKATTPVPTTDAAATVESVWRSAASVG
jgi:hypothetical protein